MLDSSVIVQAYLPMLQSSQLLEIEEFGYFFRWP